MVFVAHTLVVFSKPRSAKMRAAGTFFLGPSERLSRPQAAKLRLGAGALCAVCAFLGLAELVGNVFRPFPKGKQRSSLDIDKYIYIYINIYAYYGWFCELRSRHFAIVGDIICGGFEGIESFQGFYLLQDFVHQ